MTHAPTESRATAVRAAALFAAALAAVGAIALLRTSGSKTGFVSTPHGRVIPIAKRLPAGAVTGPLLAGGDYQLRNDAGSVVLMNFFASYCGPCQVETPQLDALYRQRSSAAMRFVGVDVKDGSQSGSRNWLADKKITFPVIWDQPGKTATELGHTSVMNIPDTVLIDKHGRIAAVYLGGVLPADVSPALDVLAGES